MQAQNVVCTDPLLQSLNNELYCSFRLVGPPVTLGFEVLWTVLSLATA